MAPRWSRQSTNPPTLLPRSAQTRPPGQISKASSAAANLWPLRLTNLAEGDSGKGGPPGFECKRISIVWAAAALGKGFRGPGTAHRAVAHSRQRLAHNSQSSGACASRLGQGGIQLLLNT